MIRAKNDINCFKRSEAPGAHYYYRFLVPSRWRKPGIPAEVVRSSGTALLTEARERAWEDFQRITGGSEVVGERRAFRSPFKTIEEALLWYEERAPVVLQGATRSYRMNGLALRRMLERLGMSPKETRLDVLVPAVWEQWVRVRYAEAGLKWPAAMKEASALNGSLNSEWRQIKSIFGDRARREVFAGWSLPDLEPFLSRPSLRAASTRFVPIPRLAEMDAHFAQVPELWARLGYELARFCGLRRSEIVGARWDWLEGDEGRGWVLRVEDRGAEGEVASFEVKAGGRAVPVSAARVAKWRAWAAEDGGAVGWLVRRAGADSPTARENLVGRELSGMVRAWLPDREKSLHELRKAAGSEVLAKTGSMAMCAEFLGDTIQVAEAHYGRVELRGRMAGL